MTKKEKRSQGAKSGKTAKLSITKTRIIERGFSITIKQSRDVYLSEELNKYKNIRVVYD